MLLIEMSHTTELISVDLLNSHGELEWSFCPKQWQSFFEAASDAGLSLTTACCSWACFVCACQIKEWWEYVDIGLLSVPLVDIEDDQVLTCVGGVKDSLFLGDSYHKIVLQKLM